jgi:hypothetical protein
MPTVSIYEFDEVKAKQELMVREFAEPDTEWLAFVVGNRKKGRCSDDADIIIGPVANDDVFRTIALFESGDLDEDAAIKRFKIKNLYKQVLFCNEKALQTLEFKSSYTLEWSRS